MAKSKTKDESSLASGVGFTYGLCTVLLAVAGIFYGLSL